jgi:signal transduction histidine kinase
VLRDITERKQTQRKMESLYQEECRLRNALQEEIDNRSKYTRALVHELKTPLTAILSSGELLETEIHDEILQDVVKNIRQASLHLERRTNELIDLACGEIGMLKVESEPLDMQKLLDQIVHKMSPLAAEKGLCLKLDLENIPLVNGDGKRTRMVLSNIIHNAIKYSESGDIIIRARDFDNANLLVQVKDNGCGIGREQMEKLFDPYRRKTTEGQKYGGIGVGLAVSRLYIELQKGKIWVESIPHKGTTVNFTLPVWREININLLSGRDNTSTVRLSSHPLQ